MMIFFCSKNFKSIKLDKQKNRQNSYNYYHIWPFSFYKDLSHFWKKISTGKTVLSWTKMHFFFERQIVSNNMGLAK